MSTMGSHIRAAETGRENTASVCLALVSRAAARLEDEQAAFRKARAEMREAIRLSGPVRRITTTAHKGHTIGAGISIGRGVSWQDRRPSAKAMEVIREYQASGTMKREECAARAMVSTATVTKYARMIAEGRL